MTSPHLALSAANKTSSFEMVVSGLLGAIHNRTAVIVFDMDGTAIDNEFTHRQNLEKIAQEHGANSNIIWPWNLLAGASNAIIHQWICNNHPGFTLSAQAYNDAFTQRYTETAYTANPALHKLHSHLLELRIVCGLNTSTPYAMACHALASADYTLDDFDILTGDMLTGMGKQKKPASDGYDLMRERLCDKNSIKSPTCFAWEDTRSGSISALRAGYFVFQILDDPNQRLSPTEADQFGDIYQPITREQLFWMVKRIIGHDLVCRPQI